MTRKTQSPSEYDGILAAKKKARRKETFRRTLPLYLMMLPGIAYLICNNYLPMFGILLAFKKVNFSIGIFKSPWCGLKNFEFLFATKDAGIMIRNTLLYNVVWILLGMVIALFIAICMAEISRAERQKLSSPLSASRLWFPQSFCPISYIPS